MPWFLPPNLLALFAPREPLPFKPLPCRPGHYRNLPYTGVAQFLSEFENPEDTPAATRGETKTERKERKKKERQEQAAYKLEQDLALWDPHNNESFTSDPYKTLFVARINYDTSERKLRREFEEYGPVKKIVMVKDNTTGKSRGYAFIEYENKRDMHAAHKYADGKKIDGRRVLVDAERARTVDGWRPKRLGGGLGNTRKAVDRSASMDAGIDLDRNRGGRFDGGGTRGMTNGGGDRRFNRSRSRERGDFDRDRAGRFNREGGRGGDTRDRSRERERRRKSRSRSRDRRRRNHDDERKDRDHKRSRYGDDDERSKMRRGEPGERKYEPRGGSREREFKEEARGGGIKPEPGNDNMADAKDPGVPAYVDGMIKAEPISMAYGEYASEINEEQY